MTVLSRFALTLAAAGAFVAATPSNATPTYNKDIAPILYQNCARAAIVPGKWRPSRC